MINPGFLAVAQAPRRDRRRGLHRWRRRHGDPRRLPLAEAGIRHVLRLEAGPDQGGSDRVDWNEMDVVGLRPRLDPRSLRTSMIGDFTSG